MDDEAEEEEEEEGMAGLGDFGFTRVAQTADKGEDERVEEREDDFENIVDELSDDEGGEADEAAGQQARIKDDLQADLAAKDEVFIFIFPPLEWATPQNAPLMIFLV